MVNKLQTLLDSAIINMPDGTIQLDEGKAAELSGKLGEIASGIEMSATELEGPISEAQPMWTGRAAEEFFTELSKLLTETKEIGTKISENKKKIDTAVSIIMAAENNVKTDVSNLSDGTIFKNA